MSVSPSLGGLRGYSQTRLNILKSLRDAGVQDDVGLPHLVAVGTQSAGKSSIIEAISTLKLPRNVGTCTRCPMEFRLENSPTPSSLFVDISLRFSGHQGEIPFRSGLTDLDEIRLAISEAQQHILQPTLLNVDGLGSPDDRPRGFSEDCVCVHAKGPNMPDLYFYDIPGVIRDVADGEDEGQIHLIERLVEKYVEKPDCIVLLVITCETEQENQGVRRLVFKDAHENIKKRTVGVLSKADRIVSGLENTWIDTFNNKTFVLENGWFAVKLPAQDQADLSWNDAREEEYRFFANTEPWKSKVLGAERNRLGSERLSQHVSKLLSNLVTSRLPKIYRNIIDSIDDCHAELAMLPEHSLKDAHDTIVSVIDHFTKQVTRHIEGIPPKPFSTEVGLIFRVKQMFDQVKEEISKKTPLFSPQKKTSIGNADGIDTVSQWKELGAKGDIIYLDEVIEYAKNSHTRELPGQLPSGIIETLIRHFIEEWKKICTKCFKDVKTFSAGHLNKMVHTHFAAYERGGLLSDVEAIVEQQILDCAVDTMKSIERLCEMELVPATLLREEYIALKVKLYTWYRNTYQRTLTQSANQSPASSSGPDVLQLFQDCVHLIPSNIAVDTLVPFLETVFPRSRTADEQHGGSGVDSDIDNDCNNAFIIMSSVQAYLEIASKRYGDVVTASIDHVFLHELDSKINHALRTMPANTSAEKCLKLIQDPSIPETRRRIIEKKNRLEVAKKRLDDAQRNSEGESIFLREDSTDRGSTSSSESTIDTIVENYSPLAVEGLEAIGQIHLD